MIFNSINTISKLPTKTVSSVSSAYSPPWMIGNSPTSGDVNVSTDFGSTWTKYSLGIGKLYGITYGITSNNTPLWIVTGSQRIATSDTSGTSWTATTTFPITKQILSAAYGKDSSGQNLFMVGGYSPVNNNSLIC